MANETDMRNELYELQRQMNEKTDESLDSTRRMLNMCVETQDVGGKTLEMLGEQGEKLDNIEENMAKIKEGVKEAEKNLTEMEKCCGLCVLPWKRNRQGMINDEVSWKAVGDGKVCAEAPRVGVHGEVIQGQGPYIKRITNDSREDEMEQNLTEVSGIVGNLKNMAMDMNCEINKQNKQLDRINEKANDLDMRVQNANVRCDKILKS